MIIMNQTIKASSYIFTRIKYRNKLIILKYCIALYDRQKSKT